MSGYVWHGHAYACVVLFTLVCGLVSRPLVQQFAAHSSARATIARSWSAGSRVAPQDGAGLATDGRLRPGRASGVGRLWQRARVQLADACRHEEKGSKRKGTQRFFEGGSNLFLGLWGEELGN